jgi:hypothetical protein
LEEHVKILEKSIDFTKTEMKAEKEKLLNVITQKIDEAFQKSEDKIDSLACKTKQFCCLEKTSTLEQAESEKNLQDQVSSQFRDFLDVKVDEYKKNTDHLENHLQARIN